MGIMPLTQHTRQNILAAIEGASRNQIVEAYAKCCSISELNLNGGAVTPERTCTSSRVFVAFRTFLDDRVGFAYTSDSTIQGLRSALKYSRLTSVSSRLQIPSATRGFTDGGEWSDDSSSLVELCDGIQKCRPSVKYRLKQIHNDILLIRSDGVNSSYSEGSTTVVRECEDNLDVLWGRNIRVNMLNTDVADYPNKLFERVPATKDVPMCFFNNAGAAFTAILTCGLVEGSPLVARSIAKRIPDNYSVVSNGADPSGPGGGPIDDEGTITSKIVLAENGCLRVGPDCWGAATDNASVGVRGCMWRSDLTSFPVSIPVNVAIEDSYDTSVAGSILESVEKCFVCKEIDVGAMQFSPNSGHFSVPCRGYFVRQQIPASGVVSGVIQGCIIDVVDNLVHVEREDRYSLYQHGSQNSNILISGGLTFTPR